MNINNKKQLYKQLRFLMILQLALSIFFILFSFSFTKKTFNIPVLAVGIVYFIVVTYHFIINKKLKIEIDNKDSQEKNIYKISGIIFLLLSIINPLLIISGGLLIKKNRSIPYILSLYALVTDILVIFVSAINIFKPYVSNYFVISMLGLIVLLIFHGFISIFMDKLENTNKKILKILNIIYAITSLTGNVFPLIISLIIYINRNRNMELYREGPVDKLMKNNAALIGMLFVSFLMMISICSFGTFDYSFAIDNSYSLLLKSPSLEFPFGTDNFGRCVFSRVVFGARISLVIGIVSTLVPAIIGGGLGAIAGFYGNKVDNVIMRLLDVLYAIPTILLAITIIAAFGASTTNLIIALSLVQFPMFARTMRASVLQISNLEYVEASRAIGENENKILIKHVIPNSLAPMIVRATLSLGTAVISTSSLSYLGLGVEPHIPEWGNILKIGSAYLETNPYLATYPGIAIVLLVLSFNFLGDGLRDAIDPKG